MPSIRNLSALEIREQLYKIYPSGGVEILMDRVSENQRLLTFSLSGMGQLLTIRNHRVVCNSKVFKDKMILRVKRSFPRHQCVFLPAPAGGYFLNMKILDTNDIEVLLDSLRLMEYVGQKLGLLQNE